MTKINETAMPIYRRQLQQADYRVKLAQNRYDRAREALELEIEGRNMIAAVIRERMVKV